MDLTPLTSTLASNLPELAGTAVRSAQTPEAQRQAVAGQFEAILMRQFLSKSVGSMMGGDDDAQGSIYSYFLTDTLAQKLSQGGGMGLSKIIAQQLTPEGESSAKALGGLPSSLKALEGAPPAQEP